MNKMWNYICFCIAILCLSTTNASITFPRGVDPNAKTEASQTASEKNDENSETSVRGMAQSIANLGLRTFRDILANDSNVILSPVNIYTCLGILDLGAWGETKEEIRNLLGTVSEDRKIGEILRGRQEVSSAYAVFLDNQYVPKAEFVNEAMSNFHASIMSINSTNGEESKNIINGWVKDHTNGSIVSLLHDPLPVHTKLVLVSALLFKGKWLFSFPPQSTFKDTFVIDESNSVDIEFMRMSLTTNVLRNTLFDAVSFPYQGEQGMSMHIILPKTHGFPALKRLLSHLNTNSLKKLRTEAVQEELIVMIPKLKLQGRFSLANTLKNQGMNLAFDALKANFSGFVDGVSDLYVSQLYHSIYFEMDEEGTKASAATAFLINKRTMFTFRANRPFIFFITDNSDFVLFMGAVINPQ